MDKNTTKAISKVIKWLRETHDLTPQELADKLDKSRNYIYMIESGDRTPSLSLIINIVDLFDTTLGKFFIWVDIFRNGKSEKGKLSTYEEVFGGDK